MRLRPSKPERLAELHQHFARSGFTVAEQGEALIVGRAGATSAEQVRAEIELHLRVWQTMHPDLPVAVEAD